MMRQTLDNTQEGNLRRSVVRYNNNNEFDHLAYKYQENEVKCRHTHVLYVYIIEIPYLYIHAHIIQ